MVPARLFAIATVLLAACETQPTTLGHLPAPKEIAPDAEVLVYTSRTDGLRVSYPQDWVPQERFMGTVVAFFSPLDGRSDVFSENVNLVTDRLDRPVTVEQYTQASLRPLLRSSPASSFSRREKAPWPFDGPATSGSPDGREAST